jgi:hypothetical protein
MGGLEASAYVFYGARARPLPNPTMAYTPNPHEGEGLP